MQCFSIATIASILWLVVGYSIAFGTTGNGFWGSFDKVMFSGITKESLMGDIPESLFALFQMTFVIITPALIIGGFADGISTIGQQFEVQLMGVAATFTYTTIMSYLLFKIVGFMLGGLRVSAKEEAQGLDIIDHEERGYVL